MCNLCEWDVYSSRLDVIIYYDYNISYSSTCLWGIFICSILNICCSAVVYNVSPKLVILHLNMALHVYDDIMRMTENLSEKYIIGRGASSTVYKCVLKNCRPVAIKKLYSHPQSLKEFETELETVGRIKHRNLVSLQGYSLSSAGNLLFYDYMENGSLWDLLHGMSHFVMHLVILNC